MGDIKKQQQQQPNKNPSQQPNKDQPKRQEQKPQFGQNNSNRKPL